MKIKIGQRYVSAGSYRLFIVEIVNDNFMDASCEVEVIDIINDYRLCVGDIVPYWKTRFEDIDHNDLHFILLPNQDKLNEQDQ